MSCLQPGVRTRKRRGEGPSRRGEILEAAKRLFIQDGVEHATMRRIAAAVGVSPTALYVYFPDKTAILDGIAEGMFEALLVEHARSQDPRLPPLARLRAGLQAYVDLGLARADEYRLTFGATSHTSCRELEAADKSFGVLVASVGELMQAGVFAPGSPMVVAETLWACVHGLVMLLLNQPDHLATPGPELTKAVLDTAIKGVLA